MSFDLPLDKMTLADKLATMEAIWADLSKRPDDLPSPEWHKEILEERRRLPGEGKPRFIECDIAIADLRKELRGNSAS